nr:rhodanese-like domain-containing protein [uncultured Desulfobacter sp.]
MAPLAPQEKVNVSQDFLDSEHGQVGCTTCHNGDGDAQDKASAHKGMIAQPSLNNLDDACADCHEDIVRSISESLHFNLSTFKTIVDSRSDGSSGEITDMARERHCGYCHTSCGGCHVSRPKSVGGGFVDGHNFNKRPRILDQCTACHGSRVGNEYLGKRGQGDVHALKGNMHCVDCHKADELHAAAPKDLPGRYHLAEQVKCKDCHKDLEHGSIRDHTIHAGKVQCQVCHSQTYTNCYSCHTATDKDGLPYYTNQQDLENIKIGLNTDNSAPGTDYRYMLVRHIPVDQKLFAHYDKNTLKKFDKVPNWKRTSPHNILRKTWQNANCNHCHGNRDLFLSENDLLDYEKVANKQVVVPDNLIPAKVNKTRAVEIDITKVKTEWVKDAAWLKANLDQPGIRIIDVRTKEAYDAGHIPGAIFLDPVTELRWPWDTDTPQQLLKPEVISDILGKKGISDTDHIIVYDNDAWRAGFTLSVMDYAGVKNFSFLKGGIQGWRLAGFPLSKDAVTPASATFKFKPKNKFIVDNDWVSQNLDTLGVVIVDIRTLDQSKKLAKHPKALRAGRIPGSLKFPVYGLYMDHAELKPPEQLLFALKNRGITPDKTIVLTCNTGAWAGAGFFMLRYLGFEDVRMHDASWVGWEKFVRYPECRYP